MTTTTMRSSEEQHKLQRELADKITSNAPLDEIRILLACGAKVCPRRSKYYSHQRPLCFSLARR
jgi:hypothetical protein